MLKDMSKAGKVRPSMRMVAKQANVSVATVSHLLGKRAGQIDISSVTRERVLAACEELGYEPNVHAQRMWSKQAKTIGLIIPPSNSILGGDLSPDIGLAGFLQGVLSVSSVQGYQVCVHTASSAFYREKAYLRLYRSKAVDALFIWGLEFQQASYLDELYREGVPFVLIQCKDVLSNDQRYNFVGLDDFSGASKCVEYLIGLGHRKIGYIRGAQTSSVGIERWRGFQNVMQKHKLSYENAVVEGHYSFDSGRQGAATLLEGCPGLTAIACANDLMAAGAIDLLNEKGISVPEHISVTGGDAVPHFWGDEITSFASPVYSMAAHACEKMLQLISNEFATKNDGLFRKIFEPEFRVGKTSAAPSVI